MSSTFVSDTPEDSSSGENAVIIIVNDDSGNMSVDQEMLQQLLGNQENATLSVVRVNESEGDNSTDVNMTVEEIFSPVHSSPVKLKTERASSQVNGSVNNPEAPDPLLDLDQEEIEKIEHALQAEQSGQLFSAELEDLLDPDLTGVPDDSEAVATISLDHCYSSAQGGNQKSADNNSMSSEIDSSDSATTTGRSSNNTPRRLSGNKSTSNKRRSQRQIDKIEMETLKRIRAENEQLLKKEKEVLKQQNNTNKPIEKPAFETLESSVPIPDVVAAVNSPVQDTKPSVVQETKTSPISRLATIRQELQQKILHVESPALTKNSSKVIDPFAKSYQPTAGQKDQSPSVQSDATPSIDGNQSVGGSSNQPVRPRRQNRQPPKHLREAFDRMEFEAVTAVALKKSLAGNISPTKSVSNPKDIPIGAGANLADLSGSSDNVSEKEEVEHSLPDEDSGEEEEGSESEEGEDDPSKLWCICREPHNNRFMICCDKCEDWFHGSCVGVTRAMGRELEHKGLEWICPHCVRAEYAAASGAQPGETSAVETPDPKLAEKGKGKNPVVVLVDVMKSKTQMAQRKIRMSSGSTSEELTTPSTPVTPTTPSTATTPATPSTPSTHRRPCVVSGCRSEARPSSVYCSDSCIVTHARDSLMAMSREKSKQMATQQHLQTESGQSPGTPPQPGKWQESVEFGQLMSQPSPLIGSKSSKNVNRLRKSISTDGSLVKPANLLDETPVPVMERKSGKVLTGSLAPKVVNLEQWLKENPSYEVIRPSSLPKTKTPVRSLSISASSSAATPGSLASATSPSLTKLKVNSSRKPDSPSTSSSSRPAVKSIRKKTSMDQIGTNNKDDDASPSKKIKSDPESTRSSAKTSLKDALWNRCKESSDDGVPLADETTAERVAAEIEEALYCLFNKDVGMKYKAKYRSLIFNIKDTKNVGLYRKIIDRQIIPAQLVKMTAEELASEELAEWRERETKHQLDIIQKTELEMMTMSNKYLVKTHKGEEIIEEAGKEQLLLEGERETSGSAAATLAPVELDALQDTTSRHESHLFDLNCRICCGKAEAQAEAAVESESTESRKKKKPSSHQSSSESTSRDRHHKDSHKKKKRDDNKDKERRHSSSSRSKEKERSSKTSSRDTKHSHHHKHRTDKEKEKEKDRKKEKDTKIELKSDVSIKQEVKEQEFDIISKILSSQELPNVVTSTYEVNGETKQIETKPEVAVKSSITLPKQTSDETKILEAEDLMTKQKPSSAVVCIRTTEEEDSGVPPTWKGSIITSEFGKVNVQANSMSGLNDLSDLELPGPLDVVGRIRPEMVWDYVNQTRRAGTRDIIVIQFSPCSSSDRKNYSLYLSHLYKSSRFAVVGNVSKLVKDFYIVPLPKDSPIPLALTSLAMHGRTLDENRDSLLLGVIVRAKKNKRPADNSSSFSATSIVPPAGRAPKVAKMSAKSQHTPPSSDTSSPSLNYVPTARKKPDTISSNKSNAEPQTDANNPNTIDDIPYSPGQLLNEESESPANDSDLLKQKAMLEELNRQIEEQKQELASMSAEVAGSETDVLIPGLGEPVIPGLDGPSSSSNAVTTWSSSEKGVGTRVTPSSDPPFDHSASANPTLNLNLSNLQEIISTIQKKELEMKMIKEQPSLAPPGVGDRQLPVELFSPHDVDMRIAAPIPVPVPSVAAPVHTIEQKKPSLLNQLTDEELLAKAMEMEMEQAGVSPANPVPFFSPPRGPPGMPPHPYPCPPMMGMGPPRPFHPFPPPYMSGGGRPMGPGPYQHSPPGAFRPRHSHNGKKKR